MSTKCDFYQVLIENEEDPVAKFKMQFMKPGEFLRPQDLKFCLEKTNFTEEEVRRENFKKEI